jgi:cell wall-associated NlpC family hydrolase
MSRGVSDPGDPQRQAVTPDLFFAGGGSPGPPRPPMARRIITALLVLLLSALPAFAEDSASRGDAVGIVSVPLANVRKDPEPKSPIVTQVLLADEVRPLEKRDYRYRIAIPTQGGREGWVHQEAVQVPKDQGKSYLRADRPWIVIAAPKTPALILDRLGNHTLSLYAGTRLPVLDQNADGYQVQFPDRSRAIIPRTDAAAVKPRDPLFAETAPTDIAKTARKFLGAPMLAGGITVQGMDARGLLYTVYRIHGIDLDTEPAVLEQQAVKVAPREVLPGDVLVFSGEGPGIAVGNEQFLHAPGRAGVQVGGIHDRRFARSLRHGLRILGADPEQKRRPAEMSADEIMIAQVRAEELPLGRRIVYWAGRFIGTPYDPDPLGLYVRTNRIVADEKADCMYLTFRAVELARSSTPGEAIEQAKALRFTAEGRVVDGVVQNYEERFAYGEDMVFSGKWGRNITTELGPTRTIVGSRGRGEVVILPKTALASRPLQKQLRDGDILYWVKEPGRRVVGEIVAHLSFVHVKGGRVFLIHAAGTKDSPARPGGGSVKEVPLADYLRDTRFIGAFVTRFEA